MPNRLLFEASEVDGATEEAALPPTDPRAEHVRTVWRKGPGATAQCHLMVSGAGGGVRTCDQFESVQTTVQTPTAEGSGTTVSQKSLVKLPK